MVRAEVVKEDEAIANLKLKSMWTGDLLGPGASWHLFNFTIFKNKAVDWTAGSIWHGGWGVETEEKCFRYYIDRMHNVHLVAGEVYYFKGKISFEHLKTVDGVDKESHQEVCRTLGYLKDDQDWDEAVAKGSLTSMSSKL
jgi:hypothetical protein